MLRKEVSLKNKRGLKLACSFFYNPSATTTLPCVVYLHGNGCSRIEAVEYVQTVLSNGMNLFCFDFPGCGQSEGEFSSLGFYEQDDLEAVVQYLKNVEKVKNIAIWGRSMGAVTTLLYASRNAWSLEVSCLVLDSPFAEFKRLFKEQAKKRTSIPGILSEGAFSVLKMTIQDKAGFDLGALKPISYAPKIFIPVLFGASKDDDLIPPTHTQDLHEAYGGAKKLFMFEGSHNSQRPIDWIIEVVNLFKVNMLNAPTVNYEEAKRVFSSLRKRPTYKSPTHHHANEERVVKAAVNEFSTSPRKWQVDSTPPTQPIKMSSPKNSTSRYFGIFSPKSAAMNGFAEVDSVENSTTCNSEDVTPLSRKKTIISPSKLSEEAKSRKIFSDLKAADVGESSNSNGSTPLTFTNPTSSITGSPSRRLKIFDTPQDIPEKETLRKKEEVPSSKSIYKMKTEEIPPSTSPSKSIYKGLSILNPTPVRAPAHTHSQSYSIYSHSHTLPTAEKYRLQSPPHSPTFNKKVIFSPRGSVTKISTLDTSANNSVTQNTTMYTVEDEARKTKQQEQPKPQPQQNIYQQQPQSPLYYPEHLRKTSPKAIPGSGPGSTVYRFDINNLATLQSSMFIRPPSQQHTPEKEESKKATSGNYSFSAAPVKYSNNVSIQEIKRENITPSTANNSFSARKEAPKEYLSRTVTMPVEEKKQAPVMVAGLSSNVRCRNNPLKATIGLGLQKTVSLEKPPQSLNTSASKGI